MLSFPCYDRDSRHCRKVFKKGRKETIALNDVNLRIGDKGFVFAVGKSGSGKSALLNLIANFDQASDGLIKYDALDLSALSEKERDLYLFQKIGFVFQTYNLFDNLTVKENIALGFKSDGKSLSKEIQDLLKEVRLEGYGNRLVKNLSGGEKQRVALAHALIKNPNILLCDEPCGNLDNVNSRIVLEILRERSKKALVLIVSHSLNDAYLYADRIIELEKGSVKSDTPIASSIDSACSYPSSLAISWSRAFCMGGLLFAILLIK
ncbi:MAG: ABC transporter ATP-binding protein [Candidatus Enteromonas sp.]